ncbi:LysR family transcriptional regulator [Aliivibrio logei]|jgi:DNA-binding transcriptional LysR family regulator|uniref:LysR family transcriptional regulator n=1 Tax=Aliivibrio logei TaxID=688 RepID=UPI0035C8CFDC
MFSYEHLTSFFAMVKEGSYSQAARKLGKDRTTIREQIKALEDSYAIELSDLKKKSHCFAGRTCYL